MIFKVSLIVLIAVEFTLFCSSSAQIPINHEISDDFESSRIPKDPDIYSNSGKVKKDFNDPEPISKADDSASSGGRIVSGGQVFDERKQKKVKQKQRKQKQKRFERSVVEMSSEPEECGKCLDNRYLKHYYARDCVPVEGEYICRKSCPKYFRCPENINIDSIDECLYLGKRFRIGEAIPTHNPCHQCRCTEQNGRPAITCDDESVCWGDVFYMEGCGYYRQYVWGKCCSLGVCPPALESIKTCLYEGKDYKLGEKIEPKKDKCVSCICDEHWNQSHPLDSQSCRVTNCDIELQSMWKEDDITMATKWMDRTGCVPIYDESTCCPIVYLCPTPKESKCVFDNRGYEIGEKLYTGIDCLDCVCRVPPDFTCMRKECDPEPPGQNVETEKRLIETEKRIIETEKRVIETERRIVETEKRILFNTIT